MLFSLEGLVLSSGMVCGVCVRETDGDLVGTSSGRPMGFLREMAMWMVLPLQWLLD